MAGERCGDGARRAVAMLRMEVGCTESCGDLPGCVPRAPACAGRPDPAPLAFVVNGDSGAEPRGTRTRGTAGQGEGPARLSTMGGKGGTTALAFGGCSAAGPRPGAQPHACKDQAVGAAALRGWTDRRTDRRDRQAQSVARAEVTTERAAWAAQPTPETSWQHDQWIRCMTLRWLRMTDASTALLPPALSPAPAWPAGTQAELASLPPTTLHPAPQPAPSAPHHRSAALPETLMGTTLVWMEQDWCRCFSSTVGRGKALVQPPCLSGLVGRLSEASGD